MNLAHWLTRAAQATPQNPALFAGQSCVADYACFRDRAGQLAGWLVAQGIRPGDRVGLFMRNCPEFLIALFGIWSAGAAAVPINAKLHSKEAAWMIADSGARQVFCDDKSAAGLSKYVAEGVTVVSCKDADFDAMRETQPLGRPETMETDDLAWLFYTSGTTGRPKGVMITCGNIASMTLNYFVDVDEVSDRAIRRSFMPRR